MGLGHQLSVLGRGWVHARRRRARSEPAPDAARFERELTACLQQAPAGLVRDFAFLRVPADRPPWLASEIVLAPGDHVTTLAVGRVYASKLFDVWIEPRFQLWMRVGESGPVFKGTRNTHSFTATAAGRLFLASYFPGEWADPSGRLATPAEDYRKIQGGMTVLVIRWNVDPVEGIETLLKSGDHASLRTERDRLAHPVEPPSGWSPLWFLGPSDIYRRSATGDAILCTTHCDVGILQREAPFPFAPGTRVRWSWKVDRLPSQLPEDTLLTHDYMSLAVEFENGHDLTYYWSCALPPETGYACPLPTWKDRETHVVVRCGQDGLGVWHDEDRDLYDDYQRFVGPAPERIVRVWLIANSLFQRGEGRCAYRSIELAGRSETKRVL